MEAIVIGVIIFLACYFIGTSAAKLNKEYNEALDSFARKLEEKRKEMRGEE